MSCTKINYTRYNMRYSSTLYMSESQPANGRLNSRTKKHSESENNAVSHTTFLVRTTCQLGPYICMDLLMITF